MLVSAVHEFCVRTHAHSDEDVVKSRQDHLWFVVGDLVLALGLVLVGVVGSYGRIPHLSAIVSGVLVGVGIPALIVAIVQLPKYACNSQCGMVW